MTRRPPGAGRVGGAGRIGAALVLTISMVMTVACSGGSDSSSDSPPRSVERSTTSAPTPTGTDCEPGRTLDATAEMTFASGGQEREYVLTLPPGYDGTTADPLLFSFHGFGSSKELQETNTSLGAKGSERGFIVVTPDALGEQRQWNMFGDPNAVDDFAFIGALLDDLERRLCVDHDRIYAAGHSNGSAFTGFLACKDPFRFTAVAMVAATIPSSCPDGVHPSVLAISGDSDPQVPYDGGSVGGGTTGIPPAAQTMAAYRELYGCDPASVVEHQTPGVVSERATGCTDGVSVGFDTVVGGTHAWPGGAAARVDPADSEAGRTWDASTAILDFFEQDALQR